MPSWEDYLRQHVGVPVQQAAQNLGQRIDQPLDQLREEQERQARLHALQQLAQSQASMHPSIPLATSDAMPSGGGGGAASENMDAGTMDEMAAARQKQLDMNNAASEAMKNENQGPDLSGFSDVPSSRFNGLKNKLQDDEEDDEDTRARARNDNNRAGTAEGSYGDNK